MKLIPANDHIVIEINSSKYLVDTGAPGSVDFINPTINVNGNIFRTNNLLKNATNPKQIETLTGVDNIAGIIGMDIIQFFGGIVVDFDNNIFDWTNGSVTNTNLPSFPIKVLTIFGGSYILTESLLLDGTPLPKVVIDTGAFISYVQRRYLSPSKITTTTYTDFNPILGKISGYFYNGELKTTSQTLAGELFGELPELINFSAVIGLKAISCHYVKIDLNNNLLYFAI